MQLCICTPKRYVAWVVIRSKYIQIILCIYVTHSLFYAADTYHLVSSNEEESSPILCEVMCTAIVTLQTQMCTEADHTHFFSVIVQLYIYTRLIKIGC